MNFVLRNLTQNQTVLPDLQIILFVNKAHKHYLRPKIMSVNYWAYR